MINMKRSCMMIMKQRKEDKKDQKLVAIQGEDKSRM